jgi:hypothetical protein
VDSTSRVLALAVATSFAAGLNTYATVATLGVLARTGVVDLPASLEIVASWPVIGAAAALYLVEFVADKIPAVDLAWNVLHTFVRVPAAALIAYAATAQLTPTDQLIAAAVGSLVALAAHGGKTAARVAVTPSPEPFSNIALSLGEASRHPIAAAAIALAFVAAIVASIRFVVRAIRRTMHEPRPARA